MEPIFACPECGIGFRSALSRIVHRVHAHGKDVDSDEWNRAVNSDLVADLNDEETSVPASEPSDDEARAPEHDLPNAVNP